MAISEADRVWFCGELERAQSSLYRLALSITCDSEDAGDAVAEAVYRAYARLDRLRDREKCRAWLLKITANEARAICRKRKRTVLFGDLPEEPSAAQAETDDTLWQAVQTLEEKQREAVVLFYYEELTTEEISRIVGATPGAVRTRLSRAREVLRKTMEEVEHRG